MSNVYAGPQEPLFEGFSSTPQNGTTGAQAYQQAPPNPQAPPHPGQTPPQDAPRKPRWRRFLSNLALLPETLLELPSVIGSHHSWLTMHEHNQAQLAAALEKVRRDAHAELIKAQQATAGVHNAIEMQQKNVDGRITEMWQTVNHIQELVNNHIADIRAIAGLRVSLNDTIEKYLNPNIERINLLFENIADIKARLAAIEDALTEADEPTAPDRGA